MMTLAQCQYREFADDDTFKEVVDRHNILRHELFSGGFYAVSTSEIDRLKIENNSARRGFIWITLDKDRLPVRCGITDNADILIRLILREDEEYIEINYLRDDPTRYWARKYKQELKRIISYFRNKTN